MRRKLPLLFGAVFLAFAAGACEGPAGERGPVGPEGPAGDSGPVGPEGPAGENAAETCSDCHASDATIVAIETQYEESVHGEYMSFERDTNPCNTCHTSQGFTASLEGTTIDDVANPARVNCRTCHTIHTAYDATDFALATTDPPDLMWSGTTSADLGNGNLCVNCHQSRTPSPDPTVGAGGQDSIPSSHYGSHHGTQGTIFNAGAGMPVFEGSATLPTEPFSSHLTLGGDAPVACVGCHMQEPFGAQAGGHTWNMTYVYHGATEVINDGTCNTCHTDATAELDEATAEVEPMLEDLAACLAAEGVITYTPDPDSASIGPWEPIEDAYVDNDLIAAYLVFQTIAEDGSWGAHHPSYVPAILTNTNETMDAAYATCAP